MVLGSTTLVSGYISDKIGPFSDVIGKVSDIIRKFSEIIRKFKIEALQEFYFIFYINLSVNIYFLLIQMHIYIYN